QPWDEASAEALTRVYEDSGLLPIIHAVIAPPPVQPEETAEVEAAAPEGPAETPQLKPTLTLVEAATAAAHDRNETPLAAAGATQAPGIERDWLEARFQEIAERVEQSLAVMQSDDSLQALDERL